MATKKVNHLDIPATTEMTKRGDTRSMTGKFIGAGVYAKKVARPAAGYGRDENGEYTIPKMGWLTLEEWNELDNPKEIDELLAKRAGTATKWDGIGYLVEVAASPKDVERLMPILKEGHWTKQGLHQVIWFVEKGGFASPLYLSAEFHDKLTKLATELPTGKVKITLYRYDKDDPMECEVHPIGAPIMMEWRNKDERSRILSKKKKAGQALTLLDLLDIEAEKWREKKRRLNRERFI